jgi:hypothetical protein
VQYTVQWVETTRVRVDIEASSKEEALAKIKEMDQEELDLMADFDNGGMEDIYIQEWK